MVKSRLTYGKFQAWIEVDGIELQCNAVDVNRKDKEVECWVPSEAKKKEETKSPCQATLFLDGKQIDEAWYRGKESVLEVFDSLRMSKSTERPFMFAELQATDDDTYLDTTLLDSSVPMLGKITLKVERIINFSKRRTKKPKKKRKGSETCKEDEEDDSQFPTEVPELVMVHEKSKKAATMEHQVGYGEQRTIPTEYRDDDDDGYTTTVFYDVAEPLVTFNFTYRAQTFLNQNLILSRPRVDGTPDLNTDAHVTLQPVQLRQEEETLLTMGTTPLSLATDEHTISASASDVPAPNSSLTELPPDIKPEIYSDDDDVEDIKALRLAAERAQAEVERVRAEKRKQREESGVRTAKRIKVEFDPNQRFFTAGEIVDLTSD